MPQDRRRPVDGRDVPEDAWAEPYAVISPYHLIRFCDMPNGGTEGKGGDERTDGTPHGSPGA